MSAYVVDDSTINKMIAFFYTKELGESWYWPTSPIREAGYDLSKREERERLGNDMFALNIEAVEQRYGRGEAKEFRPLDYRYTSILPQHAIPTLKALGCWKYQCSEGTVPETDFFRMMEKVYYFLAAKIVHDSPEYDAASWG